ncbi:MAG: hypothetical protein ACI9HA_003509 [Dinoroseobacter sp.]|jgi:hypothetical protein
MATFQVWLGEARQRLMTNVVNRTFKKDPGIVDRLATMLLGKMIGEVPHDPELDHPE